MADTELKKAVPPKIRSKYRNPDDDQPFLNKNAVDPSVRNREEYLERVSDETAKRAIKTYNDKVELDRVLKESRDLKKVEGKIAILEDLNSTPAQVKSAAIALDRLVDTLPGRELFRKAFIERGHSQEDYVKLYEKNYALGTDDTLIEDQLDEDGEVVKRGIGYRLALECRKEASRQLEKVFELDRKEEVSEPNITIVIGVQMEDAANRLNKRYSVDTTQWSEADS